MSKYDPLERHLSQAGTAEVVLKFADIERILGQKLPNSARRPQWWANEEALDSRHVQKFAWRRAGYDAFLIEGANRVRFTRNG